MTLFILFVGIIVVVGIVSMLNQPYNKSSEQSHHSHPTNDFLTNDAQISSQESHHCADYSASTSDSSCGSSGE